MAEQGKKKIRDVHGFWGFGQAMKEDTETLMICAEVQSDPKLNKG